jgi:hypothetical protein
MDSPNITAEAEHKIDCLVRLAHCVEPLEHVSGRIKLRVPLSDLASAMPLLGELERGVGSIPGIKNHEVSVLFRSATIRYDPGVLPLDLWEDFCSIRRNPSAEKSVRDRLRSVFEARSVQNSEQKASRTK